MAPSIRLLRTSSRGLLDEDGFVGRELDVEVRIGLGDTDHRLTDIVGDLDGVCPGRFWTTSVTFSTPLMREIVLRVLKLSTTVAMSLR